MRAGFCIARSVKHRPLGSEKIALYTRWPDARASHLALTVIVRPEFKPVRKIVRYGNEGVGQVRRISSNSGQSWHFGQVGGAMFEVSLYS